MHCKESASKKNPPVLVSSSEEEEEEYEESVDSEEEWEMDLKQRKQIVDRSKEDRPKRDYTLGRGNPKVGEVGSLKEIMVGYAGAVEEAPEWEELELNVDSGASVTVIGRDMVIKRGLGRT